MDAGENGNLAQLLGYEAKAGEEFKARSRIEGDDTWYGENNYEVGEEDRVLDVYVNGEGQLYVEDHKDPQEPDVPEEDGPAIMTNLTFFLDAISSASSANFFS